MIRRLLRWWHRKAVVAEADERNGILTEFDIRWMKRWDRWERERYPQQQKNGSA